MEPSTRTPDESSQGVRVTDDARSRAAAELGDGLARGSLDAAEYDQRVSRAWTARYAGELAALTADLPGPAGTDVARAQRDSDLREWLQEWRWWLGGAVIMSAIWAVQAIRSGTDFFWPLVPLAIWAAILIAVAIWPRENQS